MTYDSLYLAINAGVLPAWLLLIVAPRWRGTHALVHSYLYPVVYCVIYGVFLTAAIGFDQSADGAGMSDLAGILALFSHPVGALTG